VNPSPRSRPASGLMATLALLVLAGCAAPGAVRTDGGPAAATAHAGAPVTALPPGTDGAIYQPATAMVLFEDLKARRVGDTLTIRLAERTQASKSASTAARKESSIETGAPTLLGRPVTRNGDPVLSNEWETSQEFAGQGNSSQSNRLDGSITVTVTQVLPNGNLRVEGEKWLALNQGEELIHLAGIVRPADIGPDNSVSSLKVADARISYRGKGVLADANSPGLLTRFFMKLWPL
jgi:flagellar L-ring protein precursor FlgH